MPPIRKHQGRAGSGERSTKTCGGQRKGRVYGVVDPRTGGEGPEQNGRNGWGWRMEERDQPLHIH